LLVLINMANKKSAAKKVTKKVAVEKKSVLHQEVPSKNVFLIIVLAAFIIIAATVLRLY